MADTNLDTNSLVAQMPPDAEVGDEYLAIEPLEGEIETETAEDGSLIVYLGDPVENTKSTSGDFYENLADGVLPETTLQRIATDLLRKIDLDKQAREDRDKQYEEGIRRTGLGKDAPGGADFEGASRVVHPMLTEACIDFLSRIMKELWPPSGPVKPKILGSVTKEKVDRAKRKVDFMNYQLTTAIKEARGVTETTLTQVPLGGSQFIKQYWDHRLKRPKWQFVPIDKIYLPANAESFESAHRRTFVDSVSAVEFHQRVDQGLYRDIKASPPSQEPEKTGAQKASDKVEGKAETGQNIDGDREIFEVMSYLEITREMADVLGTEEEGELYPYLISIDTTTRRVLSLYRDWEEKDPTHEPIEHIFEIGFIPWRGALAIGLPHIIGGLSGAATGSLRALLDSAHIANTQGGLILKGSGTGGQTKRAQFGEFTEIDGGMETQDIRQKVMQFQTKEPSTVLFQLLGFLVEAGKGAVRTSLDEMPTDTNTNVPVGTQLSRVEEGLVVFSSIHGRVHAAFNRILAGLHRLNRLYLPAVVRADVDGKEIMVRQRDFMGPPDVSPVSDPTIYSDQQRFAQIQAVMQRSALLPGIYKQRAVEERFLKLLKMPEIDELLQAAPQPHELNAVNENLAMSMGRPVVAFPDQDHLAHLQVHLDFMSSPIFGMNPILAPIFLPACVKHCMEHICYFYVHMNVDLVSQAAKVPADQLMSQDSSVKAMFDRLLALASQKVMPRAQQIFARAIPVLQHAMQMIQQMAPKPPMDPALAATQAAAAETQRKSVNDQGTLALKGQAQAAEAQNQQVRNAIDMERVNAIRDNAELAAETKLETTAQDNQTAEDIAEGRIAVGRQPGYKNGESLTP